MTPELWFTILAVLQLGDIYTTLRALRKGAVEANPLVRPLIDLLFRPLERDHCWLSFESEVRDALFACYFLGTYRR